VKTDKLEHIPVDQLVEQFVEIGLQQDNALLTGEIANFNRLYGQKMDVLAQLKKRDGDQRHALLPLYNHPNTQVRLNAVKATLAVQPQEARRALEAIANSKIYPQAGDAGMSIINLDSGIFKPT
jgi:hypothetical protein